MAQALFHGPDISERESVLGSSEAFHEQVDGPLNTRQQESLRYIDDHHRPIHQWIEAEV